MKVLEIPVLNGNLLERERGLLTRHFEQVLMVCGSYDTLQL